MDIIRLLRENTSKLTIELQRNQVRAVKHVACKRKVSTATIYNVIHGRLHEHLFAWNGPAEGHECSNERGRCGCIHAEQRIIAEMVRNPQKFRDYEQVIVTPWSPCTHCANLLIATDVFSAVVFDLPTDHDTRGLKLLTCSDIPVFCLNANVVKER